MTDCIVIGAGVIGCTIALQLQRAGHAVVLLEADAPGAGASSGNAGMIGPNAVIPLVTPGLLRQLPGLLFGADRSVLLAPHAGISAIRWFQQCLRMANQTQLTQSRNGLFHLNQHTLRDWRRLMGNEHWEPLFRAGSTVSQHHNIDNDATLLTSLSARLRREVGVTSRILRQSDIRQCCPALQATNSAFTAVDHTASVRNPQRLLGELIRQFIAAGGEYRQHRVSRLQLEHGKITGLSGLTADHYVLAAGHASAGLLPTTTLTLPLIAERGYHIMLKKHQSLFHPQPGRGLLPCVLHDATRKRVISEMDEGIRVTGFVEYCAAAAPANPRCYDRLEQHFRDSFPDYPIERLSQWYGHRPSTPDSLPYIGRHPMADNLILAFGHGHYGMSGAPKTAQLVQAIMTGSASAHSLKPFDPQRFSRR